MPAIFSYSVYVLRSPPRGYSFIVFNKCVACATGKEKQIATNTKARWASLAAPAALAAWAETWTGFHTCTFIGGEFEEREKKNLLSLPPAQKQFSPITKCWIGAVS